MPPHPKKKINKPKTALLRSYFPKGTESENGESWLLIAGFIQNGMNLEAAILIWVHSWGETDDHSLKTV